MRLPDFVVIGAAKSGTTSLYALLDRHPAIFMPEVKEPEFFARDDRYAQGIESYARLFSAARPDQLAGEASTLYSLSPYFPESAARLAAHVPQAKLVYIMRQPVDRAYSYYVQLIKSYQNATGDPAVHRNFEDFTDPERHLKAAPRNKVFSAANAHLPDTPELCLSGSDYVTQIEAWRAHFPREQMLFLKFEDFVADPRLEMRRITDFLGVAPLEDHVFDSGDVAQNVAASHFHRWGEQIALDRFRRKVGALGAVRRLLPPSLRKTVRNRVIARMSPDNSHIPPKMRPETRARLTERYKAQTEELSALSGLEFDAWWK